MYGYIYLTTNLVNGKQYIGKHKSETFDESYKGSGILIRRALDKYGIENFDCQILCECDNNDDLNEKERYYIELYDAVNNENFYNIAPGGQGGDLNSGRIFSEEHNMKISIANTGKIRTKEQCEQMSERMKGNNFYTYVNPENRKWSEKQRQHMSLLHSGEGNPMYGNTPWNKGIPKTEEEKRHLSKIRAERQIPSSIKGRRALHKDDKTIYVLPEEVDEYLVYGFELGGAKRKRNKQEEC